MEQITIPNKLYFKIGEVAQLLGVETYVLRYWETEFPDIRPSKSRTNQRLYKRQDVELIRDIRDLLYEKKFTIEGARHRIKEIRREKTGGNENQMPLDFHNPEQDKLLRQSLALVGEIVDEMKEYLK